LNHKFFNKNCYAEKKLLYTNKIIKIDFKGGEIKTEVNMQNEKIKNVYMYGPAKTVFEGVYLNE